jgi:predicted membrane channel-forming protein YqfA (hemolysin III family)
MPHLFVNRPRLHDLVAEDEADLRRHFRWETLNAVVYKLGGIVFIAGSILFFPAFEAYADLGAWIFFAGSLLYLLVTGHDYLEVGQARRRGDLHGVWGRLEYLAATAYLAGTVLFTVGSIFFLSTVGLVAAGAWCFVVGSLLFVLGACINVLQIIRADSKLTLQLMNLTAVTFVVGSVLFTVASVPYLWTVPDAQTERTLLAFLAWQYLVGSGLFFLGGIFNYWRAYVVMRGELALIRAARTA